MATEKGRVVVVGAGFAGLACAHALARADVDVKVLEARDRVGGRAWTLPDFADGRPVEAGAMMIHGHKASVHRWAEEFGLRVRRTPALRGGRIFEGGRLRSTASFALGGLSRLRSAIEMQMILPRAVERYRGPEVSLADFLAKRRATPLAKRLVGMMYGSIDGAEPEELSVRGLAEEANVSTLGLPWRNYQVEEGIERIASRRAEQLGDRILLRRRVNRIDWSPKRVQVHADSPDGWENYEGDAAVLTVPLGVLKAGDISFQPPLPEGKREAIKALGFGHVNKVLLVFDEAAKSTPMGRATFLARMEGDWYFLPYRGTEGAPVVIEGFLGGRRAKEIAGRREKEVLDEILRYLEQMLPGFDVRGHLKAARVIDWSTDPFSRGGYSFPAPGAGLGVRRRLAEPLEDALFFAGEATNFEGEYATLHGALDSGERAAREVLASLGARAS